MLNTAAGLVLESRCQDSGDSTAKRNFFDSNAKTSSSHSTASSGELMHSHGSDFADWTFKNVDLLRDRNREMAEQRRRESDSAHPTWESIIWTVDIDVLLVNCRKNIVQKWIELAFVWWDFINFGETSVISRYLERRKMYEAYYLWWVRWVDLLFIPVLLHLVISAQSK